MPDLLYDVSGQTGNLDIRPHSSLTQQVSGKAQEVAFDTQQMEQYNKEINAAMEEYRVRVKDIRPYMGETEQGLYRSIVQPVLNKWEMVPGFGSAGSSQASMMNAERQAQEAARRAVSMQQFQAGVAADMKTIDPETGKPYTLEKATVRNVLKNSEMVSQSPGSVLSTFGKPPAPPKPPAYTQRFNVQPTDSMGRKPGIWEKSPQGDERFLTDFPPAKTPAPKVSVEAREKRMTELRALLKANPWLATGEAPSAWTGAGKAKYQAILDRYNQLLNQSDTMVGEEVADATAPTENTFQAGKYRVRIK